ncbi:hypothetical protein [Methylobacter luteus]|uniref:hypothetical protein n=1 Tax=Methylobacter luteus TaxID=415 RepID=UPI0003FF5661|nr:hypothetical protein [Methylobacter luteus]
MNVKLIKLLASVCIVLLLIITAEWLYAKHARKQLQKAITSVETQPYKVDGLPSLALTKQPEEKYTDLVTRPLFIKGRRPVETVDIEEAAAVGGSGTFEWQLTGVYTKDEQLSALFSRERAPATEKKYLKITEGDDISGWTLAEIHKDKVILKQGSHQKELMLRKPKLKELPTKKKSIPNAFTPKAETPQADTSGNSEDEE